MRPTLTKTAFLALPLAAFLAGCTTTPRTATESLPLDAREPTVNLAHVKDDLDAADRLAAPPPPPPTPVMGAATEQGALKGLGFAQIAGQPGKTHNEKRLMAIRAARMDALRDLTEQVHGIRLNASTTIANAVVQNDSLSTVVNGTLRGARTLRVTPSGTDSYEVEMILDADTVAYIVRALKGSI